MLIPLLVLLLVFAVVWWIIQQLGLPPPIRMIAVVIFAVIGLVYLLKFIPGGSGLNGLL